MKKQLISIIILLIISKCLFGQSLKSPVKLHDKSYYYVTTKKMFCTNSPSESKTFTVPPNTIWCVTVNCTLCGLHVTKSTKYVCNAGYEFETDDRIAYGLLPVVLFAGTAFYLQSDDDNMDDIIVEIYRMKTK